eukprot:c18540_g1_i1 orf=626-796(-)
MGNTDAHLCRSCCLNGSHIPDSYLMRSLERYLVKVRSDVGGGHDPWLGSRFAQGVG